MHTFTPIELIALYFGTNDEMIQSMNCKTALVPPFDYTPLLVLLMVLVAFNASNKIICNHTIDPQYVPDHKWSVVCVPATAHTSHVIHLERQPPGTNTSLREL